MNRLSFSRSIECIEPLEDIMKRHFDEIMALYDFIYKYENFSVTGNIENAVISFNIVFSTKEDADFFRKEIDGRTLCKYGKWFNSTATQPSNDNILQVLIA